jgi:hypothetical protein
VSNDKVAATFHGADEVDLMGALKASIDRARENRKAAGQLAEDPAQARIDDIAIDRAEARQRYHDGEEEYSDAVEHPEAGEPLLLTPEQYLRAAVADMIANANHFGQCGPDNCHCLIGRLNWAINAEEVAS